MAEQIRIVPTPKQREAAQVAADNTITLYGGAVRGGKTYWLILLIWSYAKMYPRSRWVIIRESDKNLEINTLISFQKLLDEGLRHDLAKWNRGTNTVTLHNGSQVFFMAEAYEKDKELDRFKGLEVNGAGLEEINEIQERTFYKVLERAGAWQGSPGCPIKIFATCNPTKNWVKPLFYDRWKAGELPNSWAYVPAKITDNPHIDPAYVESLKLLPQFEYDVFVNGDWEVERKTGGEFYKCFDYFRNVQSCVYNPDLPLHITFDFNLNPYMTCCIHQIVGGICRQVDELCLPSPKNRTELICEEFKARYFSHKAGLFIYGDPAGRAESTKTEVGINEFTIITQALYMFKPTLRIDPAHPSVVMRGKFINAVFNGEVPGLSFIIGDKNKHTIADYTNLKEAPDGTKHKEKFKDPETKVSYEKWGHTSDANDYLYCKAFATEYAIFQNGATPNAILLGKRYLNPKTRY